MAPANPSGIKQLPVGSVVEQRRGDRSVLIVQETSSKQLVIDSVDDAFDLTNRLLRRVKTSLDDMNADASALDKRLAAGLRATHKKIRANQRLLDRLLKTGA